MKSLALGLLLLANAAATQAPAPQNLGHFRTYRDQAVGFNRYVLMGIDRVQATAMDGGGYFIGVRAVPAESPVGYNLTLGAHELLAAPRCTSYCSGASYAAFIEGLGLWLRHNPLDIAPDRAELLRMQEPDGGRREDETKVWGWWNADGPGSHFALVQLTGAGERIAPKDAMPGDFMNISWRKGPGHSVVFLAWEANAEGKRGVRFWSSQKSTNGLGDLWVPLDSIKTCVITRATRPENLFTFDPARPVSRDIKGDELGD